MAVSAIGCGKKEEEQPVEEEKEEEEEDDSFFPDFDLENIGKGDSYDDLVLAQSGGNLVAVAGNWQIRVAEAAARET